MSRSPSFTGEIDLTSAVEVPAAAVPKRPGQDLSPYIEVLRNTHAKDAWVRLDLATAAVKTVRNRFSNAGTEAKLGVAFREEVSGDRTALFVRGKERVTRERKDKANGNGAAAKPAPKKSLAESVTGRK